jgi:hypothetical protein
MQSAASTADDDGALRRQLGSTQGEHAAGRWVGTSYDGPIITGSCALARDRDNLLRIFENRSHLFERETT